MLLLVDGMNAVLRYKYSMTPVEAAKKAISRARELAGNLKATHLIFALDPISGGDVRQELYPEWKVSRTYESGPYHEAIRAYLDNEGITHVTVPGYQADDVIYTIACRMLATDSGRRVVILSSDTDLWLLADQKDCDVYTYGKVGGYYRISLEDVQDKVGVAPSQIPALKALVGGHDDVPGVPGIGKKTAQKLLAQYPKLKDIVAAGAIPAEHVPTLRLSAKLSALIPNAPVPPIDAKKCRI